MSKLSVAISDLHCRSCELLLEGKLKQLPGVNKVSVSYKSGQAILEYDGQAPEMDKIEKIIDEAGYRLGQTGPLPWFSFRSNTYLNLLIGLAVVGVYFSLAA